MTRCLWRRSHHVVHKGRLTIMWGDGRHWRDKWFYGFKYRRGFDVALFRWYLRVTQGV